MSFAAMQGSTVPQHKTFAHSKEDILGALSFYFGDPVAPEKLKDYNEHHAATLHFPGARAAAADLDLAPPANARKSSPFAWRRALADAYVGQNTALRDVRAD
jgi:hypothetical protein